MTSDQYSSQKLDGLRLVGDPSADLVVEQLLAKNGQAYAREMMKKLVDFRDDHFFSEDPVLKDFYTQNARIPGFLNRKDIIRATDFYTRYQREIGVILGCYSLPYCYLAEDGARVLQISGRIKNDTYNRLKETGHFLRNVMKVDAWENGSIFQILLKIRLLHAVSRYFTLLSGRWNMDWGYPVNQEDMAGTNLSFSFIVVKGLIKLGIQPDSVQENAYLLTWSGIGQIMGIEPGLLVNTYKEAYHLDKAIALRHFRKSEVGVELTDALMNCYATIADSELVAGLFRSQSRLLLGEKYADLLGIPKARISVPVLNLFNKTSSFFTNIYA
ncbi:DUF2236 domain-containing protein [Emticicia sp. CRIBPO]|uniref:oxygenase MpaB family protein n=1 Tax=Emticicia sp. CRIBPO TaxID=2683258 RepID=UPI001412D197|nr:oxygenase MpaB family protein [Emticicia sp. CRIBPO]NBA85491.1 DUF2236 domain-containing protein [Emticicia sp. CRIBPO]